VNEGDVLLTPLPQSDSRIKYRPALVLREMPRYRDIMICGVSSQLHQFINGFDELIRRNDNDFMSSGLLTDSVIRLGFLTVLPRHAISGSIGKISSERYWRLLQRLSAYLAEKQVVS